MKFKNQSNSAGWLKSKPFVTLILSMLMLNCSKDCPDPDCTAELTNGLLAYYPFTGNLNDASGNGNHATAVNGATLTSDFLGRTNEAAGFDGINDYMMVPGSDKLNSDAVTIVLQVMVNNSNRRNVTVSRVEFDNGSSFTYGIHESLASDNKFGFGVGAGTENCSVVSNFDPTLVIYSNPPIQPGRWYSIIASFGNGLQKLYVDGTLVTSQTRSFSSLKKCSNAELMIGGWWMNDIVSLDGKLDEIRIYNRVLSDCEIAKLSETFSN